MPVGFSIAVAIIFIAGGIYCRGSKRLRTTSKCMLFFGCLMALYSILTIIMLHRGYLQLTFAISLAMLYNSPCALGAANVERYRSGHNGTDSKSCD